MYVPGRGLLGSIAPSFCRPGRVAVIARSGTLDARDGAAIDARRHRPELVAHIGGDTVIGRNPHEYLAALAHHDATEAVLYCGEIGGDKEYALAEAHARIFPKPVVAMVVGRHAPAEKRMGHAGALVGSAREGADAKLAALAAAGCRIAAGPAEAVALLTELGFARDGPLLVDLEADRRNELLPARHLGFHPRAQHLGRRQHHRHANGGGAPFLDGRIVAHLRQFGLQARRRWRPAARAGRTTRTSWS